MDSRISSPRFAAPPTGIPEAAQVAPRAEPAPAPAASLSPWVRGQRLLKQLRGTIPLVPEARPQVRAHVNTPWKSAGYQTVASRQAFQQPLENGLIAQRRLAGVTDQSGHYRPRIDVTYRFLKFLQRQGIALDDVSLTLTSLSLHINAKRFVDDVQTAVNSGLSLDQALGQAASLATPHVQPDAVGHQRQIGVLAPDGQLYLATDRGVIRDHSGITAGGPVRWAGEIVTADPAADNNQPRR